MKIPNIVENIIYIAIIAGLLILNTFIVLKSQEAVIKEAVNKASTEISNQYDVKNKKGTLDLTPTNTINDTNIVIRPKKRHLFKK